MGSSEAKVAAIISLTGADAGEVLTLQRSAYVSEARLHNDLDLPPLTQSLENVRDELDDPNVVGLGIRREGRLVAAVRARVDGSVAEVGRLTVAPDMQGQGLGSRLLDAIDPALPEGVQRLELFTGEHSVSNIRLYERKGYREFQRVSVGAYALVYLARDRDAPSPQRTLIV